MRRSVQTFIGAPPTLPLPVGCCTSAQLIVWPTDLSTGQQGSQRLAGEIQNLVTSVAKGMPAETIAPVSICVPT